MQKSVDQTLLTPVIETIAMPHPVHDHAHDHLVVGAEMLSGGPFAPAEETLYLRLAGQVKRLGPGRFSDGLQFDADTADTEDYVGGVRARLGDGLPPLTRQEEGLVMLAFAEKRVALPRTHPRYPEEKHHHGHDHDHDACGKRHGPVQRLIEKFEKKTIGRVQHPKLKLGLALGFRALLLTMCPGDDLAAIGLQTYGAIAGHVDRNHDSHETMLATLPGRPRLETQTLAGTVSMPFDAPASHQIMPNVALRIAEAHGRKRAVDLATTPPNGNRTEPPPIRWRDFHPRNYRRDVLWRMQQNGEHPGVGPFVRAIGQLLFRPSYSRGD